MAAALPSPAALPALDALRPRCAGCRGPGGPLCPACARLLAVPHVVTRAGFDLPVAAAGVYAGPVREALVAFKDHRRWSLAAPLGTPLAAAVALALDSAAPCSVVLVPVPSTPRSVRERDGAHVAELARAAASVLRALGADVRVAAGLAVVRRRRDQVGLGRAARAANLAGTLGATDRVAGLRTPAVVARPGGVGSAVVVVDDLVTTGATLHEAVRALRAAGVEVHGAAAVAATPELRVGPR